MISSELAHSTQSYKVLLLGAGESGKSTIMKQIKYLYAGGLADAEQQQFAQTLQRNTLECMDAVLNAAETLGLPLPDLPNDIEAVHEAVDDDADSPLTPDIAESVAQLWKAPEVRAIYDKRTEYWILDAAGYYFENVRRFAQPDFVPSEEDCIMARVRTTGIVETPVHQPPYTISVVDVGGQRSERRKWVRCFEGVDGIFFVVSLVEAFQKMFEDTSVNRLRESLKLWRDIVGNPLFTHTPILLVLNKKDLLEKEIQTHPAAATAMMQRLFPDYTGGADSAAAATFIQARFGDAFRELTPPEREFHSVIVSARVRSEVRHAFKQVKDIVVAANAPPPSAFQRCLGGKR